MEKPKDPPVEEILKAIEDSHQVRGKLEDLIREITLVRKRDKKKAKKLYEIALEICNNREWYASAARAARAMGDTNDANYYENRHKEYIRSLSEPKQTYHDPRGKWGWLDGKDSW